jgi:hypothetical protein
MAAPKVQPRPRPKKQPAPERAETEWLLLDDEPLDVGPGAGVKPGATQRRAPKKPRRRASGPGKR